MEKQCQIIYGTYDLQLDDVFASVARVFYYEFDGLHPTKIYRTRKSCIYQKFAHHKMSRLFFKNLSILGLLGMCRS